MDQCKSLENWNKIFNYANDMTPPISLTNLENDRAKWRQPVCTKTPAKGHLKRGDDDEDSYLSKVEYFQESASV